MSGAQLKTCPFCGGIAEKKTKGLDERFGYADQSHATCKVCGVGYSFMDDQNPKGGYALSGTGCAKAIVAWNRRTPDPAQIRADALREVLAIAQEAVARRIAQIEEERKKPAFNIDVPQMMRWGAGKLQAEQIADEIRALIDAPLSPTAVDNSPAPDAGGKEGV